MTGITAPGFPEELVRLRAKEGAFHAFPPLEEYGTAVYGATEGRRDADSLTDARLVPPMFTPRRFEKLVDLNREPTYGDVDLRTEIGGFGSALPVYVSAFGSTAAAGPDLGVALARQAGELGIPLVIGENVIPVHGYREADAERKRSLGAQVRAYLDAAAGGAGGVVVQQSTEDADAEVWNLLYSDPAMAPLVESGRLGFELKLGQGAKPGLGGMTVLPAGAAADLAAGYLVEPVFGAHHDLRLRSSSPGTFTEEILARQIQLMRNNFPRAKTWVKLAPTRDVAEAARIAWSAGAHAVTVDGAEGGTGWAPCGFLDHVGLPLGECLLRIGQPSGCLLASGRMWEGTRAVKSMAMGATAVGLGRAALLAVDEDAGDGLRRLAECLAMELRLLISALGKYSPSDVGGEDVWLPGATTHWKHAGDSGD